MPASPITRTIGSVLLALLSLGADIPTVGRPARDFYGATGSPAVAEWPVPVARVAVGDPLEVTLVVVNVTNAGAIVRPDLRTLPAFADAFRVEDAPDAAGGPASERAFRYRLFPRSPDVTAVPELKFGYYDPQRAAGGPERAFRFAYAEPVPIEVFAPAAPPPEAGPPADIDPLTPFLSSPGVELPSSFAVPPWAWPLPPALAWLGLAGWRWRNPSSARLARLRRDRAASACARQLERARDLAAIERAVRAYRGDAAGPLLDALAADRFGSRPDATAGTLERRRAEALAWLAGGGE